MDSSPFPKALGPSLKNEDVISYLMEWQNKGWSIITEENGSYSVVIDELRKITIRNEQPGIWRTRDFNGRWHTKSLESPAELRAFIAEIAKSIGINKESPNSIRLSQSTPASNLSKIVALVGSNTVEGVLDPYLDQIGLDTLLALKVFRVQFASSLRLVTARPKGITKIYLNSFMKEIAAENGECRTCTKSEHRRFMLLSGGQVLILGCSLNSLAKNEVAHLEKNQQDINFFNELWIKSSPI